ncbi:hypothetical protein B0H67DRAFT_122676 [Lasiosphaeris hirsuta]|uniref:Uncharacterized protein n=1 Tax=Lasiosphaeris hirsuta TaxID=260670 RepID=A0AA40E2Z2_9PEZI|nr:hypothetical protein B0H67DRAFT_122676 [Lasiosphaeris hirsuta]
MPRLDSMLEEAAYLFDNMFPFWRLIAWLTVVQVRSWVLCAYGCLLPLIRRVSNSWVRPTMVVVGGLVAFIALVVLSAVTTFFGSLIGTLTLSFLATALVTVAEVSVVFWIYLVMIWLDAPGSRGSVILGLPRYLKVYSFFFRVTEELLPAVVLSMIKMPGIPCTLYRFDQWAVTQMYGAGGLMTHLYPAGSLAMHANLALHIWMQTLWALGWYDITRALLDRAETIHFMRQFDAEGNRRPVPVDLPTIGAEWKGGFIISMSCARLCGRILYLMGDIINLQGQLLESLGYTGWMAFTYRWAMKMWIWLIRVQWDPAFVYVVDESVEWLAAQVRRRQRAREQAGGQQQRRRWW